MSRNPSNVTGGTEASLATNTLGVTVASKSAVMPTVHIQQAATVRAYRFNCAAAGLAVAAKTHQRFRQKCRLTAKMYAAATAPSRGSTCRKTQMRLKSARATMPPTTQNRTNLFASENMRCSRSANKLDDFRESRTLAKENGAGIFHRLEGNVAATPVAQASKPAVSPTSKSAGCRNFWRVRRLRNLRYSRLGSLRYGAWR